jgi:hypothetical protein
MVDDDVRGIEDDGVGCLDYLQADGDGALEREVLGVGLDRDFIVVRHYVLRKHDAAVGGRQGAAARRKGGHDRKGFIAGSVAHGSVGLNGHLRDGWGRADRAKCQRA